MIGKFSIHDCAMWFVFRERLEVPESAPRPGGGEHLAGHEGWTTARDMPTLLGHGVGERIVITLTECFSPHAAPVQEQYVRIRWRAAANSEERVRVIAWTCDCRATVYELCHAGGQAHLRRTCRRAQAVIHESYRWTFNEADELWAALLRGEAR